MNVNFDQALYLQEDEIESLERALLFAKYAHKGQKRATGEPYIIHPIAVCEILMNYQADHTTLIAALLHDVVEDTSVTLPEIGDSFGSEVALIVEGLTKEKKGNLHKEEYSAINVKKLLSASVKDIRILIIKLADRLHNMRTLEVKKIEKKVPYANETLLFFSPLAERLGLYQMQEELEELSFKYLNPPKFHEVQKLVINYTKTFIAIFDTCSDRIIRSKGNLDIKMAWEREPIYKAASIIQEKKPLAELFMIKLTTKESIHCYTALGIVHQLFQPLEHFEDNIAIEKSMFSKHLTTKVLINEIEVKFIIQTEQTSIFQLLKTNPIPTLSSKILKDTIQSVQSVTTNPIEFHDLISFELFQKELTVFTPKMDIITLPEKSTVIDFAFHLNPHLARKMSASRINGLKKPIYTVLHDMDIVELVTTKQTTVQASWLNHIQTAKALKEIKEIL
ncbi:hypothetical protein BLX88_05290 [Bacillus obstructivus]|nr:hypothetical protein BLX88_05290 [Bacillus obstructivus]